MREHDLSFSLAEPQKSSRSSIDGHLDELFHVRDQVPRKKAEAVPLAPDEDFEEVAYRILESAEGHPPGRSLCRGDQPYPSQFNKPDLWFLFDDEFGYFPMKRNCWGVKGPILVARVDDDHYSSLHPDEIEGIVKDLDQELRKDPNDWEQQLKDLGKYFDGQSNPGLSSGDTIP